MKKLILLGFLTIGLTNLTKAQVSAMNFGYQESDEFGTFIAGVTANHIDFTFFINSPDFGDDSNFIIGIRPGYLFHLYKDRSSTVYIGPHIGAYFLERTNFSGSGTENTEWETSLNYGFTAGVYFRPINIAFDYGVDDLFESQYFGFKIGLDFFNLID